MAELKVALRLDARGNAFAVIKDVDKALGGMSKAENRVDAATRRANRSIGRQVNLAKQNSTALGQAHRSALQYGAAFVSFTAAQRVLSSVVDKTVRQEQALAQVEARIRSTGGAAGYTTDELATMAANFQKATAYGDEEILELQSTLLSFRGIGRDAFEGATEATLNLAVAMRTDLRSAVLQIGKALDDPKRGLDGLSRSGTQFTDAQKEQIKALVDAGKKAEAQALVLKELETQYGNSARAARETLGGALAALGNAFGDLQEISAASTGGIAAQLNNLTDTLSSIDTEELHSGIAAVGEVVLWVGTALAGKAALGLLAWGSRAAWTTVKAQALALAATGAAAKTDLARVRMLVGASQARRYGVAIKGASVAVRGLSRALAVAAGPAGWLALGAYTLYEFATTSDTATEAQDSLARALGDTGLSLDKAREKWEKLTEAEQANLLASKQREIAAQKQRVSEARLPRAEQELIAKRRKEYRQTEARANQSGHAGRNAREKLAGFGTEAEYLTITPDVRAAIAQRQAAERTARGKEHDRLLARAERGGHTGNNVRKKLDKIGSREEYVAGPTESTDALDAEIQKLAQLERELKRLQDLGSKTGGAIAG